jgi:phage terminase large subunit
MDIYIKEIFYETKKTNKDLIRFVQRQLPERAILICDSAEPDRIAEFKGAGIRAVPARKGAHSVLDGIDFLKRHRLHITKDSLNVIKEISGYKWKTKKDIGLTDAPVEVNDHSLDAVRYYCWTVWGKKETDLKVVWI